MLIARVTQYERVWFGVVWCSDVECNKCDGSEGGMLSVLKVPSPPSDSGLADVPLHLAPLFGVNGRPQALRGPERLPHCPWVT